MNIEDVEERAILNLKKDGHCCGVILFDEPQFAIIPMNYNNEEQKNHFRNHVRRLFNDMKITRYFVVTETWVSSNPYVDAPSRDINRKEALMISEYSTDNINGKFIMILFFRNGKNIVLGKRVFFDKDSSDGQSSIDRFNFFKEELTSEEREKIRRESVIKDLVRRVKCADLTEEFESFLKYFPNAKITYEEFKKMFIKLVTDGKITFKDGIIPKKFRLPTDEDDDISLNKMD